MLAFESLLRKFPKVTGSVLGMSIGTGISVAILMTSVSASAMPIVAFGDSLSDTGNDIIFTAGIIPPPAFYFKGRFSNGPVWLDQLGAELGSSVNPALNGGRKYSYCSARVPNSPGGPRQSGPGEGLLPPKNATRGGPHFPFPLFGGAHHAP